MRYVFTPLFLLFAFIEYGTTTFCGGYSIVGTMWFMWIMMALMCCECYVEKIRKFKWR